MFGLQKILETQLRKNLRPQDILLQVIKKKLSDLGVRLNQSQLKLIRRQLKDVSPTITLDFSDDQIARAKIKSEPDLEKAIQAALADISSEALKKLKKIENELPDKMERVAEEVSGVIFRRIRRTYRFGLKDCRDIQVTFENNLYAIWGKAISQLEVLVGLAMEAGENMVDFVTRGKSLLTETKWVVLSRLHARACQIAGEIVALLKAGYADGAYARWRSLHEVTVVLAFIFDHEDTIAEQYLMHDDIEEYKSAVHELELFPALAEDEEFMLYYDSLKAQRAELARSYGQYFLEDYGWAAGVIKGSRPTFRKIEQKMNLSHLRPYYREASHNIHASVRGTFSRLGLHPDINDLLLAGASDFGLAGPGHLAALSLSQATVILLQGAVVIDSIVFMKVIMKQQQIVGKEFWRTHRRMMKKHAHQSNPADQAQEAGR